jgi:diguanylate cyclase (GGDEF)-like protein/PAS domain S-box-containing protein
MSEKPLASLIPAVATKVTPEQRRQEALLKTDALQKAIFNSENFSSIATDAQGVIQIFNVGAERMLGYTAGDVVNKITPADISDPQEVVARAEALSLELGTPITPGFEALVFKASRAIEDIYELTYIRKDGSRFPAVVSVTALRDVQEAIIGYLLIGTDNTARKQAEQALLKAGAELERLRTEEALRTSEQHYRTLFESIDEGFCIIEKVEGSAGGPLDFRYIEANAAFAVQSGISDVLGKTIRQVAPGETEEWFLTYDQVLQTGEPIRLERGLITQGRVLELHAFRVEGETHCRVGISFKDITKRKLAENALRESEAFNLGIVKSSPDCIKVLDLDGNLLSMESGQALLGIEDIQPFLNTSWIEFWDGEHRLAAQAAITLAISGKAGNFVGFFRTLRGEPKWWDVAVTPILDIHGQPRQLLAVSRDVTQRRQAELNFEFLASVSRDLVQWTNVDEMMQTLGAKKMAAHFDLSLCAFAEIDETAEQVVVQYDWHREDVPSLVGVYRLADFVEEEFIRVARAGEVIVVRDVLTDSRTDPKKFATLKIVSFICAPLIRDGQWRFALCLYKDVAHDWRADEIELARELSVRVWTRLERLRAEAALRESEARFRGFVTASSDAMFCMSADWVEMRHLDGQNFSADTEKPHPNWLQEYISPDDQPQVLAAINESIRTKNIFVQELRMKRVDGSLGWTSLRAVPLLDARGDIVEWFGAASDVTKRKQATEALRDSEARFRAAVDTVSNLIWTNNADGLMEGEQPGWGNFTGQTQAEYQGYGWSRAVHPEDVEPTLNAWAQAVAEKRLFEFEHRIRRRDGEWRLCSIRAVPLFGGNGNIREWVGVHTDITERKRNEEVIRESEQRYRNLFNLMDQGYCIIEMIFDVQQKPVDWLYLEVNPSFEIQAGMSDVIGKRIRELAPDLEQYWFETLGKVALTGEPVRFVNKANVVGGRWFDFYAFQVGGQHSRKVAILFADITEAKATENALHESVGNLRETEAGLRTTKAALTKEKAALADHVLQLQRSNEHLTIATIEAHTLAEEIEKARITMAHLAQHDDLTDLPNRVLLNDRLAQTIALAHRQGKQLAVMFLDLDRFKHIHDSLGHAVGDQLLQSVAKRLMAVVRSSDTVCRQGGDEFVILLADVEHIEDVMLSAQKILAALIVPHYIDQLELHVTASIGISIYPDNGQDADTLIKSADTAMYHAKEGGRNNYQFFELDMNVLAVERHSIEAALRRALEQQEFLLHYQPKINLETGTITGVEALVRWQHPQRGLILPEQFIWIAEDCGLIVLIGAWVLREACRQARSWHDAGLPPIPVAVNISAVQFRHKDFLQSLTAILKDTGLAPHFLELELTETVLMKDADATTSVLKALKAMGVRLAIDDFGTGYSSLSYLKGFPIDTLKIDQSFMRDITHATSDSDDAAIVAAVVGMGKSLRQRVIAEGVETREQLAFLQAQGCREGQGFYFSRPLTAVELVPLLQAGLSAVILVPKKPTV